MSNSPAIISPGSSGNPYDVSCPPGQVIVGMTGQYDPDLRLNAIQGLYCKNVNDLGNSDAGTLQAVTAGTNQGPSAFQLNCPVNSYVTGASSYYGGDLKTLSLNCTNTSGSSSPIALSQNASSMTRFTQGSTSCGTVPATGIFGQYSGNPNQLGMHCMDSTDASDIANAINSSDAGKIACCQGVYPASFCSMLPQSGACDSYMSTYCQSHPSDANCSCLQSPITSCPQQYDSACRGKNGYQTSAMKTVPCPSTMTCSQYINLSPGAQALATNISQGCSSTVNTGSGSNGSTQNTNTPLNQVGASPTSSLASISDTDIIAGVGFLIFIIIVIVVVALLASSGGSDDSSPQDDSAPQDEYAQSTVPYAEQYGQQYQ
jgi:hypothetical protein